MPRCVVCNRELTDPASIKRGVGPVCAQKREYLVSIGDNQPTQEKLPIPEQETHEETV